MWANRDRVLVGGPETEVGGLDLRGGQKERDFSERCETIENPSMGLALEVGILADLVKHDPEGAEHHRGAFAALNRYLATQSLAPHQEPEVCKVWSASMYGYSGLHYLRRLAARPAIDGALPTPGDRNAMEDSVLTEYFDAFADQPRGGNRSFDHLIVHSDAEGYYIPQDFPSVLQPGSGFESLAGAVGSSQRLLVECYKIAEALGLPLDIDAESDEMLKATDNQGKAAGGWQKYGVESYSCLQLYNAALRSIDTGAAIVFT